MSTSEEFNINNIWRELKERDIVYTRYQELCHELGKKEERAQYMEQLFQKATLEINYRNCLIEKVLKENEYLEKVLKKQTKSSFSPCSKLIPITKSMPVSPGNVSHGESELQLKLKLVEEKYESSNQSVKQLENCIENLKENHTQIVNTLKEDVKRLCDEKEWLRNQVSEKDARISMLQKQQIILNENHEKIFEDLKDRKVELEILHSEYENYKKYVEQIKEYVRKRKIELYITDTPTVVPSRKSTFKRRTRDSRKEPIKNRDVSADEIDTTSNKRNKQTESYKTQLLSKTAHNRCDTINMSATSHERIHHNTRAPYYALDKSASKKPMRIYNKRKYTTQRTAFALDRQYEARNSCTPSPTRKVIEPMGDRKSIVDPFVDIGESRENISNSNPKRELRDQSLNIRGRRYSLRKKSAHFNHRICNAAGDNQVEKIVGNKTKSSPYVYEDNKCFRRYSMTFTRKSKKFK